MTKEELQAMLEDENLFLMDIREADELEAEEGIGGAKHIPMGKVFTEAFKGNIPKDKKVVSICKTGGRCRVLTNHLKERGFDADFLEGGLNAWKGAES